MNVTIVLCGSENGRLFEGTS